MTEIDHDGSADIVENDDTVKHPREHIGIGRVIEPADGIRPPPAAPVHDANIGLPPPEPAKQARMSIDQLEKILQREEDAAIEILPNGEIREKGDGARLGLKPLTMRENLG